MIVGILMIALLGFLLISVPFAAVSGILTFWLWVAAEAVAIFLAITLVAIPGWRKMVKDNFIKGPLVAVFSSASGASIVAYFEASEEGIRRVFLTASIVAFSFFIVSAITFAAARRHTFKQDVLCSGTMFVACFISIIYLARIIKITPRESSLYWVLIGILFLVIAGIGNVITPMINEAINAPSEKSD